MALRTRRFVLASAAALSLLPLASSAGSDDAPPGRVVAKVGHCFLITEARSYGGDDLYVLRAVVPGEKPGMPYKNASNEYTMRGMREQKEIVPEAELSRFTEFVKAEAKLGGRCD